MKLISSVRELQEDTVNFSQACSTLYGRGDREFKKTGKTEKKMPAQKQRKQKNRVKWLEILPNAPWYSSQINKSTPICFKEKALYIHVDNKLEQTIQEKNKQL